MDIKPKVNLCYELAPKLLLFNRYTVFLKIKEDITDQVLDINMGVFELRPRRGSETHFSSIQTKNNL